MNLAVNVNKKLTYDELVAKVAALEAELEIKTNELEQLKRLIYGQKSERFIPSVNPEQLDLSLGAIDTEKIIPKTEQITYTRTHKEKSPNRTPHGRKQLPAHLPRKKIIIEPEQDISGFKKIGQEITEELEFEPPKFFVNQYVRPKYARCVEPEEDSSIEKPSNIIVVAAPPSRPIEKGIAGPGLLANILISKFVDHLPLYRQIQQIKRYADWDLPSSTMNGWVKTSCQLLEPLYNKLQQQVLDTDYLQADETTIPVLDRLKKGKTHLGYHWVYHAPVIHLGFFDYRPGRGREGPNEILKSFKGYLQTDAYVGYDEIHTRVDVIALACMAHARRKFVEALSNDNERAEWMLSSIQSLYDIERHARENQLSFEQQFELRQKYAVPKLKEMKTWLNKNLTHVLPKSAIGKAFGYMLNNWERLVRYTEDGRLEIDNNWIENKIRPVALGRKNYLFAGSHEGARWAAIIYSLVATAQMNNIEPFAYLRNVLSRIADHPYNKLDELLPPKWKHLTK